MKKVQFSSVEKRWYTPLPILAFVREALGGIDLDPASDEFGNSRVQAKRFFGEEDDSLHQTWTGSVYLNPPGGTMPCPNGTNKRPVSSAVVWWRKLMQERSHRNFDHAIFMAFSLEQLSNTQRILAFNGVGKELSCAHFPLVVPNRRLAHDRPDGRRGISPSNAQAIIYVPGVVDRTKEFIEASRAIGQPMIPV